MAARQGHPRGAGSAVSLAQLTLYPHCMSVTSNPMIYCLEGSAWFFIFFFLLSPSLSGSPSSFVSDQIAHFFEEGSKYLFVPAWLAFSLDFHFFFFYIYIYWYEESEMRGNEMRCNAKAFLARRYRVSSSWCLEMRDHLYSIHNAHKGPKGVLHTGFLE